MEKKDVRDSVLTLLANKEKTIEALRRELEEKKNAIETLEQREGKSKGHVLKLKAMIQPLGDELVKQKKELELVKSEAALRKGEVEARNEELIQKCRLADKQREEVATLQMKLKEVNKLKEEAIEVERGKIKTMEERFKVERKEFQQKMEGLLDEVKKAEKEKLLLEVEKCEADSNVVASETRFQDCEEKLHQSRERAAVLSEEVERQALELGQLRKVEEALLKLEEMLTFVKAECAEVKRDNSILEENLKKKQKQLKILRKKLRRAPKRKREIEEGGEEKGKKRKFKQEQGESATEQVKVLQQDVPSICLKVEMSDSKVNVAREEDVETAMADDADAEEVGNKREPGSVLKKGEVVNISDDEVLYISDEDSEQPLVSEELEGTVFADPQPLDPSYCSTSSLSNTSPSSSGLSQTVATLSPISSSPLDISGSPPQLQAPEFPPLSEPSLRLRDLKSLVESPSQGVPTESKTERVMSLKHEMKHQVELALKKYYQKSQPHMYSQRSWEIFDDDDFAEVCRMLAVQAREEVLKRWGLEGDSQEDLWILEEDIYRMRGNVDYFFYLRKEFAQRLSKLMSLQDPFYLKEMHAVASLLFSLLPTFNIKQSTSTFDFYFDVRNAVSTYSHTLGIDLKPLQEVTLRLYRQLLDPNNEPVLDNDIIWEEVRLMHQIEEEKNNVH